MKAGGLAAPAALGIALHGLIPYRGVGRRADAFCMEGPASDAGFCRMAHCAANAIVPPRAPQPRPAACLRHGASSRALRPADTPLGSRACRKRPCLQGKGKQPAPVHAGGGIPVGSLCRAARQNSNLAAGKIFLPRDMNYIMMILLNKLVLAYILHKHGHSLANTPGGVPCLWSLTTT